MKKIIALQGKSNSGKTQTLKKLRDKLEESANHSKCIHDTLSIHTMSDGTKIGIYLDGDVAEDVKNALAILINEDCDIIFCACRTKGGTVHEVTKHINDTYEIQLIGKSTIYGLCRDEIREEECNNIDCLRLWNNL